jgi:hypothetical protein
MSAIKSGDSTDAKTYLAQVEKLAPSNTDANSPLGEFLSSVSTALGDNNIAGAQSALTTLETYATPSTASTSSTAATSSTTGDTSNSSGISALGQDVLSLFSAISSGDETGAQSAYDSLTSLLSSSDSSATDATSTSASSSSTSSSSTSGSSTSFSSLLSEIGSALGTGDVTSAQTALDNFLTNLSSGSLVNATA